MTPLSQKRLAIAGAIAVLVAFLGANAHLLHVAFTSQPACTAVEGSAMAAKRAC